MLPCGDRHHHQVSALHRDVRTQLAPMLSNDSTKPRDLWADLGINMFTSYDLSRLCGQRLACL